MLYIPDLFSYFSVIAGPPVMVDVEFKIISIGEIKEAQMVRDKETSGIIEINR